MKRLLFVLGAVLAAMLLALLWQVENPEWKEYQRAFLATGIAQGQDDAAREWYGEQPIGIREIRVDALRRVDRCTTCHLGVEDPNFADVSEPFRAHSPPLTGHPPDKFGCTICHNGRGRAVTTLAAHGDSEETPLRLWRGVYLQAACFGCHNETTLPEESVAAVLAGKKAINQLRCLRCHQIRGQGESEGPDLNGVGSRRDWVQIFAHLLNPQAMSPGSTMPNFPLTRPQAEAITVYLLTLRGQEREVYDARYRVDRVETTSAVKDDGWKMRGGAWNVKRSTSEGTMIEYDGQALFNDLGCVYCHRAGTKGGAVGPALTRISRVRDVEWLRRFLQNPAAVFPDGTMPQLYLNPAQVDALAGYLTTLR